MFIQMVVVDHHKRHGRFIGRLLCIDAQLGLDPAGVEGPQIGCLLNFIILVQALAEPRDLGKILIDI